ncbi:uncharacterized protein SPPG_02004 [Spizellomyces punctatus DAOM BR117]|uniref:Rhodanese domain-containing protein n=1 Tax=Spizellomyces punctatus (strain DAOM BR117) TaxID=645134 RepID=A0A0L0HPD7_SPIPD|nr:uncharacterized protein SPPG_02004 [Spizellomyces punctatus DAOM BR117]KND02923.1 hypothetical protein SPPG_02004 [Spizellomyces punctatus DAOM BR117]|eukprot:XP_016610962.1 hypothetical protein SPPG_02004 [Spizellomyces punctatus DAOM BR117]
MLSATRTVLARRLMTRAPACSRAFSQTPASLGLFSDYVKTLKTNVKEITSEQLNAKLTKDPVNGPPPTVHVLDVRETYEWNEEHLPFAVYTGRGCLERDIEGLIPDQFDEIILYCAGGNRSIVAADSLQKMGYKNVYSLAGGIGGWKKDGYQIVQNFKTYSDQVKGY